MANVLEALIIASERAASIARSCCIKTDSESLFVAEKHEDANSRFKNDFKTIADVLCQEAAKHEISLRCKGLGENVRGEECNEIGGFTIQLHQDKNDTLQLLSKLVPQTAAEAMVEAAYCKIKLPIFENILTDIPGLDLSDLGVWIDPIDATAEFIAGVRGESDSSHGLPCVTVLIGAYLKSTGEPVIGVINQPFYSNSGGRIIWGVSYGETKKWGEQNIEQNNAENIVLMSEAENPEVRKKFELAEWEILTLPGAGHKLLKVVLDEAAVYVVSKGTTFRWDTCSPHAILLAKGGGVVSFNKLESIKYNEPLNLGTQEYCNTDGIIAYSNPSLLEIIKKIF